MYVALHLFEVKITPLTYTFLGRFISSHVQKLLRITGDTYNLFAFPSECNFSGMKFNLDLVNVIKEELCSMPPGTSPSHSGRWMVLIDAAKGSTTSPPDLSKYKADFVVVSFYKLFGYPTGIGALIVRNGTVAASIADIDFYKRRDGIEEYLEDGTISFISIASLHHGFKILNTLTMTAISRHAMSLANYVRDALLNLRHANGNCVSILYGPNDPKRMSDGMGPIVSFNLKRRDGSWFGYREVEKLASLSNIQLRRRRFLEIADVWFFPLSFPHMLRQDASVILVHVQNISEGHVCWDDRDIVHGKPTGAVRVSFGYMSIFEDARKFLKFVETSFVSLPSLPTTLDLIGAGPFDPVTQGLLHDREWLLKSLSGEILTQKKVPEMSSITTLINLKSGILLVESPRCKEKLEIELVSNQSSTEREVMDIYRQR
ncbi:hypothetical protein RD792_000012 [Penstemon davidsonii]|uniref:Molybdenum cofactor sulfurase n=1 Tax=Penstemon davidsonii TaxID=160366 RepID=A0ABR0DVS3_9LAMI|nr:hypothetical protein RD792_000012 [Penstemon davidsonii]